MCGGVRCGILWSEGLVEQMEIGAKLRQARLNARLTQEETAQALGVSRQTISNWENEKTYPDIVSVVKLSDLFHVSLDHLLKEEQAMSNYLDYLEESTNVVKSNDRRAKTILVAAYLAIWAGAVLVFWLFTAASDAMGYSLVFLWGLLPLVTFLFSLLIGWGNYWGRGKWLCALGLGVMHMLAEYATFSAANMAAFHTLRLPDPTLLLVGAVVSAAGLAVGRGVARLLGR